MSVATVGLDIAKQFFQVHGVDANGRVVLRKKLRRSQVAPFFANLPPCTVGLEACCGSHYWVRVLSRNGHRVRLMAPQFVKPYVKSNKNDANDAEAICEAVSRPHMRFVPLVSNHLQLTCSLDILLLWRDKLVPVGPTGDIDNRLKTLFDALQIPPLDYKDVNAPSQIDEVMFVLLENDNLITDVRVATDRLLTPYVATAGVGASHQENVVHLIITVKVHPNLIRFDNLAFIS